MVCRIKLSAFLVSIILILLVQSSFCHKSTVKKHHAVRQTSRIPKRTSTKHPSTSHSKKTSRPLSGEESKIVGGQIVKTGEYPFAAHIYTMLLDKQVGVECGGSIMTSTRILTACHCLASIQYDQPVRMYDSDSCIVSAGSVKKQDKRTGQLRKVKSFSIHPLCIRTSWGFVSNDLGIVTLSYKQRLIYTNYVQPMSIPSRRENDFQIFVMKLKKRKQECSVVGWGVYSMTINASDPVKPINYSATSNELRLAKMSLITDRSCEDTFCYLSRQSKDMVDMCHYRAKDLSHICANAVKKGVGDCRGDSGGPLICMGYVVGVVSSGFACGSSKPSVYTSIAPNLKWLGLTIKAKVSKRTVGLKRNKNVEKSAIVESREPREPREPRVQARADGSTLFTWKFSVYSAILAGMTLKLFA